MTHIIPGRRPVIEALRAPRPVSEVVLDPRGRLDEIERLAGAAGVPVRGASQQELDNLAQGVLHQGVVARTPGYPYCRLDQISDTDLVVMLDGVTDPQNLGAIARSAEVAGAGALVLPERRSAHITPAAEKAAAGAFSWLQVALVPNLVRALGDLAQRGFWSVGLDGGAEESIWSSTLLDGNVVLVVGSEGRGLARLVAERVDGLARIPMRGRVESLNASAAAAVTLAEIVRRRST